MEMKVFTYVVERIDGDYVHLRNVEKTDNETKLVARALVPPEATEGSRLLYEWMQYRVID